MLKTLRKLQDSIQEFDQITQHIVDCQLEENTAYAINLRETDSTRGELRAHMSFQLGQLTGLLNIQDTVGPARRYRTLCQLYQWSIDNQNRNACPYSRSSPAASYRSCGSILVDFSQLHLIRRRLRERSYESQDPFGNPSVDLV